MHERRGGEAKRNGNTLFVLRTFNHPLNSVRWRRAKKLAERAYRNVTRQRAHHRARQQMTDILSAEQPLLISIVARVPSSWLYWYQGLTVDSELDLGSP